MNPCYWTPSGRKTVTTVSGATIEPCRTICGNGFLDIEEECERIDQEANEIYLDRDECINEDAWTPALYGDKPSTTVPGDVTSKVYCSESC